MPQNAEITIVIPVHNRAGIVGKTLESVRCQSHRPLAVILVDNNSIDNTLEVLEEWKRTVDAPGMHVTVTSEPVAGATAARNRGLNLVTTPFVMFFDSDDTMAPNHVARALEAFHSHPHADIVGWDIGVHLPDGTRTTRPYQASDPLWSCILRSSMGTQRYAMRTELARRAGGWNPAIPGWNDIEFGIRLLLLNPVAIKAKGGITVETFWQRESITGSSFSASPQKWETSLDEIERNMPSRRTQRYVHLKRALLAGDYALEGASAEASRLMQLTLAKEPCPFYRTLLRIAFAYRSAGGRGGARLLRWLF